MSLVIVARSRPLSAKLRDFVERRVYFALSRFEPKIERVELVLSDANGPRGGVDQGIASPSDCRSGPPITVVERQSDVSACVASTWSEPAAASHGRLNDRNVPRSRTNFATKRRRGTKKPRKNNLGFRAVDPRVLRSRFGRWHWEVILVFRGFFMAVCDLAPKSI